MNNITPSKSQNSRSVEVKVLEWDLKLKNFFLFLNFMKNYRKSINQIYKESGNEIKQF